MDVLTQTAVQLSYVELTNHHTHLKLNLQLNLHTKTIKLHNHQSHRTMGYDAVSTDNAAILQCRTTRCPMIWKHNESFSYAT